MCSPTGLMAATGFSIFGIFFLSLLAILIKHGYPYVGEWFETTGEDGRPPKPLSEQQRLVVSALWQAVFVYVIVGGLSLVGLALHKIRMRL